MTAMKLLTPMSLETSISVVDAAHQSWLDLIKESVPLLLKRESAGDTFALVLERLRTQAENHFATIEALLEKYAVDARHADAHREEHRGFLHRLESLRRQGGADPVSTGLGLALLSLLIEWLCFHVFDRDLRLASQIHLIEQGRSPQAAYEEQLQQALPETARNSLLDALAALFSDQQNLYDLHDLPRPDLSQGLMVPLDLLTGLANRGRFFGELQRVLADARNRSEIVVLMHIDVDGMLGINQSMGMEFTDSLLAEIARRLRDTSRRQDLLGRIGNDDFTVALVGGSAPELMIEAAERLYVAVSRELMSVGREGGFTLSAGIAVSPKDGSNAQELMASAEWALNAAKQQGGACVRQYEVSMGKTGFQRAESVDALRQGIRNDELVLYYQPQVGLTSGEIIGIEALVRWQHKTRGMVPPGQFIPLAEESGLVVPLGEWVLAAALEQSRRWQDGGLPPVRIAVNISAQHFRQSGLVDLIEKLLEKTGVAPHLLEIEMTESVMAGDPVAVIAIVDRLKKMGVRLSLDDFGTGYSSLAYLSRFAIDMLKIDQSFVRDITSNPTNASIVMATIAMAHKLGKSVIAEGVETEEQMNFLRRHDCDEMQGFLFSRPQPAAGMEQMLREGRMLSLLPIEESDQPCLLLVDDEPNVLNSLKRLLRREGYRILTAQSGAQGLDLLASNRIEVILSDQRMPEMTGSEFLSRAKSLYPDTVRLMLSGYSELAAMTDAVNRGAIYKFLSKPWSDEELKTEIRLAFRHQKERAVSATS
jgi:diguanylate cyclase (GGDEF)-like protein/hemerythrin-like metal-binding protein